MAARSNSDEKYQIKLIKRTIVKITYPVCWSMQKKSAAYDNKKESKQLSKTKLTEMLYSNVRACSFLNVRDVA